MEQQNAVFTDFSEAIERWAYEDMLQLAHHFHRLNKKKAQYERTSNFVMNKENDVPTFDSIRASMKRLRIYMALDANDKEKFTFFPILEVQTDDGKTHYFKLYAVEGVRSSFQPLEVVPKLFKDIIAKNWDVIDLNLIDDLFVATKKNEHNFDEVVRVKYYEVKKEMITNVIQELPKIKGITLYSGIDMNKFSDKTQISFTPVLGFQFDEPEDTDDYSFGLKSIMEFTKGEVFLEYSRPCPPTC
ncbi:hypothetical protein KORDIASMS9_01954 [Kordia sp. SMS9]|uniref:hypothetical protein n=1 Tax=Kordia sp. SMS9 TaxID=2282170 RepID=UPI000E0CE38B|nr:hypothetical protein [Kordia sp. SMS9]AXG69727.1 hypothetical protein KORDIASMS9_01954 [Kordia sp. SMS9]